MDFDVIGGAGIDTARAKRLLVGYATGALICGASIGVAVSVSAQQVAPPPEEDVIDVKLAASAAAEEKPPEPPPPPPPKAVVAPVGRAALVVPKAIPTTAPEESNEKKPQDADKEDPFADGKGG